MGGASTEIGEAGEAAPSTSSSRRRTWTRPSSRAAARRHKLPSEASRRFERGVDPQLPPVAAERAARLLVEHGGGTIAPGRTDAGAAPVAGAGAHAAGAARPRRRRGRTNAARPSGGCDQVGCSVEFDTGTDGHGVVVATPPSWRPDLVQPADLVEEVLRLEGYDTIPSVLPPAPPGRGLTPAQRGAALSPGRWPRPGCVEVLSFPFVGPADLGRARAARRRRPPADRSALVNPLDADRAALRTTLLPGLLDALVRNLARGFRDLLLYDRRVRSCCRSRDPVAMPDRGRRGPADDAEYAQIKAALPAQPVHVGVVLAGDREQRGWWGAGPAGRLGRRDRDRPARRRRGGRRAARHDGRRCRPGTRAGAPRCASGTGSSATPASCTRRSSRRSTCRRAPVPSRSTSTPCRCATTAPLPQVSPYPPVSVDVALVAAADVPAAELTEALEVGGGDLLE